MEFKIREIIEPTGNTGQTIYAIDDEHGRPIVEFHSNEDNIVERCCCFLNQQGEVDIAILKLFFRKIWSGDKWFNWYYPSLPEFMNRYVRRIYL